MVNRAVEFSEKEYKRMNWTDLAQDKDKWQIVVTKQWAFQLHKMSAIWDLPFSGTFTALMGSYRRFGTTYWSRLQRSSIEDRTDTLFRNVGNQLPINAALKFQNSEDLLYNAAEAWSHARNFPTNRRPAAAQELRSTGLVTPVLAWELKT